MSVASRRCSGRSERPSGMFKRRRTVGHTPVHAAGIERCRHVATTTVSRVRWEDDGQDDHDSEVVRGGPNGGLSLDAARAEYRAKGGHPGPHVAPVRPE